MTFKLTQKHIQNGFLTDEDFSEGLGFKVKVLSFTDFPHSEELQKFGVLPPEKLHERANGIYKVIQNAVLNSESWDFGIALDLAERETSCAHTKPKDIELKSHPRFQHYDLITKNGYIDAHAPTSPIWSANNSTINGNMNEYVFPGVLEEDVKIDAGFFACAAIVLLERDTTALTHWAHMIHIPVNLLDGFSSDNKHILNVALHEKRHLHQIGPKNPGPIFNYYRELDADLYARSHLSIAGVGSKTMTADIYGRYIAMFYSPPNYWFATALEDIEARERPKDFFTIHRAVMEVKLRTMMGLRGEDSKHIPSKEMQAAIKHWNETCGDEAKQNVTDKKIDSLDKKLIGYVRSIMGKNPAPLYTALRKQVERGVFDDPFTHRIATRILDAAHYFNPDFLMADFEPSRRRISERLNAPSP